MSDATNSTDAAGGDTSQFVTLTVEDSLGATASCVATVTVVDDTPPDTVLTAITPNSVTVVTPPLSIRPWMPALRNGTTRFS